MEIGDLWTKQRSQRFEANDGPDGHSHRRSIPSSVQRPHALLQSCKYSHLLHLSLPPSFALLLTLNASEFLWQFSPNFVSALTSRCVASKFFGPLRFLLKRGLVTASLNPELIPFLVQEQKIVSPLSSFLFFVLLQSC